MDQSSQEPHLATNSRSIDSRHEQPSAASAPISSKAMKETTTPNSSYLEADALPYGEQYGEQYGDRAIYRAATEPLEKWPNPSENAYSIHLEHPEFTALCPRSGYPDFGVIVVDYQPDQWVVELKAFKLYINAFRNQRISHEAITNQICDRLWQELEPVGLRVIGDFTRRGGVKTVITVQKGACGLFLPYTPNLL